MTSAFATAEETLFADPNHGSDGVYAPAGGAGVTVRCILTRVDNPIAAIAGGRTAGARAAGWRAFLKTSEVPTRPPRDSTLTVGGRTFKLRDAELDALGLQWECEADPA